MKQKNDHYYKKASIRNGGEVKRKCSFASGSPRSSYPTSPYYNTQGCFKYGKK